MVEIGAYTAHISVVGRLQYAESVMMTMAEHTLPGYGYSVLSLTGPNMSATSVRFLRSTAITLLVLTEWGDAHDANAVIIAHGDGSGNTSAPPDDPG